MMTLTAKVIRLRKMPEESIRQVFIPDHYHDHVNDDHNKIVSYDCHEHDHHKIVNDHIAHEEEDGVGIELGTVSANQYKKKLP